MQFFSNCKSSKVGFLFVLSLCIIISNSFCLVKTKTHHIPVVQESYIMRIVVLFGYSNYNFQLRYFMYALIFFRNFLLAISTVSLARHYELQYNACYQNFRAVPTDIN
jgi:hypothetical protein